MSRTSTSSTQSSRSLHDYQLGDSLGKGAFGQVYRALNWATGETVAIKQISLSSIPASSIPEIMSEISLLKNLNHPNIVTYRGFAKTRSHLYIILEFCENGSLHGIVRKYGKFPEGLVGVYVAQVLEGLVYLHEQGVIHRDIKGANILTNKDGTVKLADFGVASSTTTGSLSPNDVVGSPYWMAPEVIEQSGATTSSDIWSLGCVVIELLEGSPPYGHLDPMPAMFRIVQDDGPPIPEGASAIVKDFLGCCFQKDPNLRISAKRLLGHAWMVSSRRGRERDDVPLSPGNSSTAGDASANAGSSASGALADTNAATNANLASGPSSGQLTGPSPRMPMRPASARPRTRPGSGQTPRPRPMSNYSHDEAVLKVQEWNQAIKPREREPGMSPHLSSGANGNAGLPVGGLFAYTAGGPSAGTTAGVPSAGAGMGTRSGTARPVFVPRPASSLAAGAFSPGYTNIPPSTSATSATSSTSASSGSQSGSSSGSGSGSAGSAPTIRPNVFTRPTPPPPPPPFRSPPSNSSTIKPNKSKSSSPALTTTTTSSSFSSAGIKPSKPSPAVSPALSTSSSGATPRLRPTSSSASVSGTGTTTSTGTKSRPSSGITLISPGQIQGLPSISEKLAMGGLAGGLGLGLGLGGMGLGSIGMGLGRMAEEEGDDAWDDDFEDLDKLDGLEVGALDKTSAGADANENDTIHGPTLTAGTSESSSRRQGSSSSSSSSEEHDTESDENDTGSSSERTIRPPPLPSAARPLSLAGVPAAEPIAEADADAEAKAEGDAEAKGSEAEDESYDEDFLDEEAGDEDTGGSRALERRVSEFKARTASQRIQSGQPPRKGLFHPDDIRSALFPPTELSSPSRPSSFASSSSSSKINPHSRLSSSHARTASTSVLSTIPPSAITSSSPPSSALSSTPPTSRRPPLSLRTPSTLRMSPGPMTAPLPVMDDDDEDWDGDYDLDDKDTESAGGGRGKKEKAPWPWAGRNGSLGSKATPSGSMRSSSGSQLGSVRSASGSSTPSSGGFPSGSTRSTGSGGGSGSGSGGSGGKRGSGSGSARSASSRPTAEEFRKYMEDPDEEEDYDGAFGGGASGIQRVRTGSQSKGASAASTLNGTAASRSRSGSESKFSSGSSLSSGFVLGVQGIVNVGTSEGTDGIETEEGGADGHPGTLLKLNTRLSNRSWIDEDDSDEEDPFAEFDEGFSEEDLEAHVQRAEHARLSAHVGVLVDQLTPSAPERQAREVSIELFAILATSPEMQSHLVSAHGMLAILEVLEAHQVPPSHTPGSDSRSSSGSELAISPVTSSLGISTRKSGGSSILDRKNTLASSVLGSTGLGIGAREIILQLLRIVNLLVTGDIGFLESFCLIGGIPVVMGFTSKRYPSECRLEASNFIRLLCNTSVLTLQMFIACRGLKVLVDLLDEDCAAQAPLVIHALDGIASVFDLQSPTTKNDFCRMFVREGLLDPLSAALLNVMASRKEGSAEVIHENPDGTDSGIEGDRDADGQSEGGMKIKIIRILLVFSQVSQSDVHVRNAVGTRKVVRRLLRACELLEPESLVLMLKAVKHLSMNVALLDVLQNANAIEILVRILEEQATSSHSTEMSNHIFQTCFNLCRINRSRQEEAAQAGIIPCLQRVAETQSPLKQFALPILCDMASAGKSCRMLLWQHDGLNMYLRFLGDPYFQLSALESIWSWLQDEPARIEDELIKPDAIRAVLDCFVSAKANSFETLLDLFLKITRLSVPIATAFSKSASFFRRIIDRLTHNTKPVVRLNLLRILKAVCEAHPNRSMLVERYGLLGVVEGLSRGGGDGAVLVRELAKEIVPVLKPGLKPAPGGSRGNGKVITPKRMRRTASEASATTVSSLGSAATVGSAGGIAITGRGLNSTARIGSTRPKVRQKLGEIPWKGAGPS